MTVAFLVLAAVVAVSDWIAIGRGRQRVEYVAKPLTLVLLIVAACFADLGVTKPWVLTALALSLLGDIALLLPTRTGRPTTRDPTCRSC